MALALVLVLVGSMALVLDLVRTLDLVLDLLGILVLERKLDDPGLLLLAQVQSLKRNLLDPER